MIKNNLVYFSTVYITSNVIGTGFSIIFLLIAMKLLTLGQFGQFSIGLSFFIISNILGLFGMNLYIPRFLSGNFTKDKRIEFGNILLIIIITSLIVFISLFFSSNYLANKAFNSPELSIIIKCFSAAILFSLPKNIISYILEAQKKATLILYSSAINGLLKIVPLILIFYFDNRLLIFSLSYLVANLVTLIFLTLGVIKNDLSPKIKIKRLFQNKIYKYNYFFSIITLGNFLTGNIDKLILGILASNIYVGIYSQSIIIPKLFEKIHGSIMGYFMPTTSNLFSRNKTKEIIKIYKSSNLIISFLNISFFLIILFFGKEIISIFTVSPDKIYNYALLLSIPFIIGTLIGPTSEILTMMGKHRVELINSLTIIILSVFFYYFLINLFNIIGAIIATIIITLILKTIQIIEIKKYLNIIIIDYYQLIILIAYMILFFSYDLFRSTSIILKIFYFGVLQSIIFYLTYYILIKKKLF
ncbi:MAG: lipopolysaccharide biosynthesis protein [Candidatus Muiribacteriota bacterium]